MGEDVSAAARPGGWFRDPENLLFAALLALHVVPLWCFAYFPSQDGPAHLENATILREYNNSAFPRLREYYVLNARPDPNWFVHLALAGLMAVVPAPAAEKILLTGYVVLLPLAARYALAAVRPSSRFLAVLAFPFVYNALLHRGFYNFCYSLPVFFFVLGYWMKHRESFGARQTVVLAALGLVLYFCHLVSVVTVGVAMAVLGAWWTALDARRLAGEGTFRPTVLWPGARSRVLLPLLAFAPTLGLAAAFLGRQGTAALPRRPWRELWDGLRAPESLVSYLPLEQLVASAVAWLFALTAALLLVRFRRRRADAWDGLLLVALVYVGLYFAAPEGMSQGTFLNLRLNLYPFFALLLWFGAHPFAGPARAGLQAAGAVLALALLGLHAAAYAELDGRLGEYVSAGEHVEPNTTLLPLCFAPQGRAPDGRVLALRTQPFRHAAGHIAARRRVVDLDNYEADTGYFPVLFRPGMNPYEQIGAAPEQIGRGFLEVPPRVEFLSYPQKSGQKLDYVLLWGARPEQRDRPDARAIFRQLEEGFDLVFTSPRGLAQLYRRKDWGR